MSILLRIIDHPTYPNGWLEVEQSNTSISITPGSICSAGKVVKFIPDSPEPAKAPFFDEVTGWVIPSRQT